MSRAKKEFIKKNLEDRKSPISKGIMKVKISIKPGLPRDDLEEKRSSLKNLLKKKNCCKSK
jgi:hypothetical protein